MTKEQRQIVLSVMLIITIGIAIYLTTVITTLREDKDLLIEARTQLTDNIETLNNLNAESNSMVQELTLELQALNEEKLNLQNALNNSVTLDSLSVEKLKQLGYEDYSLILNDLMNHNELIPFDGVLGGSMAWRLETSFILDHQYVYATFDDGHILGAGVLKFEVTPEKHIKWTIVDAVLFE